MKATDFEYRCQLLLHELIVGAALLTYLVDRDDIVWRFIRSGDHVRPLERGLFAVVTLLFGLSAYLCTLARANAASERSGESAQNAVPECQGPFYRLRLVGDSLYALTLASLLPLSGFFILVIFESIRLLRLSRREYALTLRESRRELSPSVLMATPSGQTTPLRRPTPEWAKAFRREAIKWGFFLTMIVFTLTLKDRIAEILIGATIVLWTLLNLRLAAVCSGLRVCAANRHT
jgi:hypothetical protein